MNGDATFGPRRDGWTTLPSHEMRQGHGYWHPANGPDGMTFNHCGVRVSVSFLDKPVTVQQVNCPVCGMLFWSSTTGFDDPT